MTIPEIFDVIIFKILPEDKALPYSERFLHFVINFRNAVCDKIGHKMCSDLHPESKWFDEHKCCKRCGSMVFKCDCCDKWTEWEEE